MSHVPLVNESRHTQALDVMNRLVQTRPQNASMWMRASGCLLNLRRECVSVPVDVCTHILYVHICMYVHIYCVSRDMLAYDIDRFIFTYMYTYNVFPDVCTHVMLLDICTHVRAHLYVCRAFVWGYLFTYDMFPED